MFGAMRLRTRILTFFVGLVAVAAGIAIRSVDAVVRHQAELSLAHDLQMNERVFHRIVADNLQRLEVAAKVLVDDFGFRSAVASRDRDTIDSVLENHGRRIGADLMLLVDKQEVVSASTQGKVDVGMKFSQPQLLASARNQGRARSLVLLDGQLFEMVLMPVRAPTLMGWVAMGFAINHRNAQELSSLTGAEVSFLASKPDGSWQLLDSSNQPSDALATRLRKAPGPALPLSQAFRVGGHEVLISPLTSGPGTDLAVALVRSLDDTLRPYLRLRNFLIVLVLVLLSATVIGGAFLAASITRPLSSLVRIARRIAGGDYTTPAPVERQDEVGELAVAFNQMRGDIAEREARISDLAFQDDLTGLPNRAGFLAQSSDRLQRHDPAARPLHILLVGLDRLEAIKGALGQTLTDTLRADIARRLARTLAGKDALLSRYGSDEFAVLLEARPNDTTALALISVLDTPFQLGEQTVDISASVGVARFPEDAANADELLRLAYLALGEARRGRTGVASYDAALDQRRANLSLAGELREAIDNDQFELYYQPKIDLATLRPCHVEALLRWHHPVRGFVPPDQFIPFAEQTGTIARITRWVLAAAIAQRARWHAQGIALQVSVNISAADLLNADLPDFIRSTLEAHAVAPGDICLEITEGTLMDDPEYALGMIETLARMGLHLSIDDFGTGYSSLAYLKRLPVHELKIDKAFVLNMHRDAADAKIVKSTIELAHNFNLKVVAEGVDSAEALAMLRDWQCDIGQGFHFSRPVTAAKLEESLLAQPSTAA